jgi:hypothetical protein
MNNNNNIELNFNEIFENMSISHYDQFYDIEDENINHNPMHINKKYNYNLNKNFDIEAQTYINQYDNYDQGSPMHVDDNDNNNQELSPFIVTNISTIMPPKRPINKKINKKVYWSPGCSPDIQPSQIVRNNILRNYYVENNK